MEDMGLKFAPVIARCLLGHLSMFGSMAGTSLTHSKSKNPKRGFIPPLGTHPPPPPTPPPIMYHQ